MQSYDAKQRYVFTLKFILKHLFFQITSKESRNLTTVPILCECLPTDKVQIIKGKKFSLRRYLSSIFFVFLLRFHQYLHWISIFVDFIVVMIHKVKFLLRCNIFINIKIDMIIVHELTFFFLTFHPQMEANEYSRMNSKWKHFLCWKRLSMFKGKNIRNNFRSYLHQVLFFI